MLSAMQQAAATDSPSPSSSSFAGLLESLAAPAAPEAGRAADPIDINLGDDIVTLSYEHALRSHVRYKPANLSVWEANGDTVAAAAGVPHLPHPNSQPPSGSFHKKKPPARETEWARERWNRSESAAGASIGLNDSENARHPVDANPRLEERARTVDQAVGQPKLRTASVTIRLSDQESAQLRQRAMEAGLTVSAYLRSCVLEADSLRAQVKEALAELRLTGNSEKPKASIPAEAIPTRRPRFSWLARVLPRRRNPQTIRQG